MEDRQEPRDQSDHYHLRRDSGGRYLDAYQMLKELAKQSVVAVTPSEANR